MEQGKVWFIFIYLFILRIYKHIPQTALQNIILKIYVYINSS